jgi:hypothetical protein
VFIVILLCGKYLPVTVVSPESIPLGPVAFRLMYRPAFDDTGLRASGFTYQSQELAAPAQLASLACEHVVMSGTAAASSGL